MSHPDEIVVVLAGDAAYAMPIAATVASIARTHRDEACRVIVFHDGVEASTRDRIAQSAGGSITLEFLDARDAMLGRAKMPDYLPMAALFRLRVGELLPTSLEKVIYIDSDVAVVDSLRELWDTDLCGAPAAAVRDAEVPWFGAQGGLPWRRLGIAPSTPYFNSGVIVIPLDLWRDENIADQVLDVLEQNEFPYGDQCGLNVVFANRWHQLGPRWNFQRSHTAELGLARVVEDPEVLDAAIDRPAVIHFLGPSKPWLPGFGHPYGSAWFEALDATPWSGWRPTEEPVAKRVLGRVRRAQNTLMGR